LILFLSESQICTGKLGIAGLSTRSGRIDIAIPELLDNGAAKNQKCGTRLAHMAAALDWFYG
jgi:hypothetical protein